MNKENNNVGLRGRVFRRPGGNARAPVAAKVSGHAFMAPSPFDATSTLEMRDNDPNRNWRDIEVSDSSWLFVVPDPSNRDEVSRAVHSDRTILLRKDQQQRLHDLLEEIKAEVPRGVADRRLSSAVSLTPRQIQIAKLVRSGASNKEIARTLGLTVGTVKVHLHRIFRTLGLSSRVQLATRAFDESD